MAGTADTHGVDDDDQWDQFGQTLDWVAALLASCLRREPADLVWPTIGVGLASGLGAEAVVRATGGEPPLVLVAVTLNLCGFGMLALLATRFRRSSGGGTRSAEADLLAPWLRRLQVLLAAVLVVVVGMLVVGAIGGAAAQVARNLLELGRVGAVVVAISFLLLDDEVGLPDWVARRVGSPRPAESP